MWVSISDRVPDNGVVVWTDISPCLDHPPKPKYARRLKRWNYLWFVPDGSKYVYDLPTHWWEE